MVIKLCQFIENSTLIFPRGWVACDFDKRIQIRLVLNLNPISKTVDHK